VSWLNNKRRQEYDASPRVKAKKKVNAQRYYSKNKVTIKQKSAARLRQKRTGYTPEEYNLALYNQHGHCKICGEIDRNRNLAADHNHVTGVKRGLLCSRCNLVLGRVEDNTRILTQMVLYLETDGNG